MDTMTRQTNFQSSEYRQALGTFATGVTVVTAMSTTGELAGLTANSFTSVSLEPPLILWCLADTSDNLAVFQSAPYFAVNILAADQKEISDHFARRQKDKFVSIQYRAGKGGSPLLDGCVTWLQCRMISTHVAGDHAGGRTATGRGRGARTMVCCSHGCCACRACAQWPCGRTCRCTRISPRMACVRWSTATMPW